MSAERRGPLSGIRILEIGHMLAGPYCAMLLADLGADVIKIEAPNGGDLARTVGPHRVGVHNTYFASLNRNKRSVVLDLESPEGRSAMAGLVRTSRGLVTNMRPAAIEKLGLSYKALAHINPRIACVALTGYGLHGPMANQPAYDYVIQAKAGIMALTGEPGGPPVKAGFSLVDNSSGIMGALALVSMIHEGRGGQADVSLFDVMLSQMNYLASAYLNAGERPQRQRSGSHPYIVPAQLFETADGHLSLFVSHDGFWQKLASKIGPPHWLSDPRFSTMNGRSENRALVVGELAALIRTAKTDFWLEQLMPLGLVVSNVETLDQALDSALTASREMIVRIPTPEGDLRLIGSPIKIANFTASYRPPPKLGEQTDALLEEMQSASNGRPNRAAENHQAGSRRTFARAISRIADASVAEILASAPAQGHAHAPAWRIGITGTPGSGKSTLIARLAKARVETLTAQSDNGIDRAGQIAVLAIDPSSPVTGGSILGDRIRMEAIAADPQIYVRSLASRGGQDGLAHNLIELLEVADAYGFREIIVETVGIGQAEHSIRTLVDTLVLVLQPETGDSVQFMKCGLMELADIYVVAKADLPAAKRTLAEVKSVIQIESNDGGGWRRPIIEVSRDHEEGITLLDSAISRHQQHLKNQGDLPEVDAARRRYHLRSLVQRRIDEICDTHRDLLALPVRDRYDAVLALLADERLRGNQAFV